MLDLGHLIPNSSGTIGIVYTRHVSRERDKKKGKETARDRTCQDGKMRKRSELRA